MGQFLLLLDCFEGIEMMCDTFLLLNLSLLRACNFLFVCYNPSDGPLSLVTLCPGLGLRPFWPHLWILALSLFFTTNCYLSLVYYCLLYPDTWIQVLLFFHTPVFMVLLNVLLWLFLEVWMFMVQWWCPEGSMSWWILFKVPLVYRTHPLFGFSVQVFSVHISFSPPSLLILNLLKLFIQLNIKLCIMVEKN